MKLVGMREDHVEDETVGLRLRLEDDFLWLNPEGSSPKEEEEEELTRAHLLHGDLCGLVGLHPR